MSPVLSRLLLLLALAVGGGVAMATPVPQTQSGSVQPATVAGQVVDENGEPLIGATVIIKGTIVGTATDFDGRFSIKVPQGATLMVSYVGYNTRNVKVDGYDLVIKMELAPACDLSEVVVTALGIKKEVKSLSYNVQQVDGDALMRVQDANFVNSLSGKVAGVTINSSAAGAGGSCRVVMRGAKYINCNNNLLYVVDGIPMQNL